MKNLLKHTSNKKISIEFKTSFYGALLWIENDESIEKLLNANLFNDKIDDSG